MRTASPVLVLVLVAVAACAGSGTGAVETGSGGSGGSPTGSGGSGGSGGAPLSDAGAGGGGTGGASATDAGTDAGGASAACRAGLRFCDDFETSAAGGPPAAARWSIVKVADSDGSATITVDGSVAHSGGKSVRVHGSAYQTFFVLKGAPAFPAPNGRLYLRLFMRLDAEMTGGHNTYFEAGLDGMTDNQHETRVGVMFGMLMINQPAGDRGFLSNESYFTDGNMPGTVFLKQQWVCVEALFDSTASEVQLWVDGADVPDLHRTDWQQDPFDSFRFGFEKYAGPVADIWYDDIAVDTQRIGCN